MPQWENMIHPHENSLKVTRKGYEMLTHWSQGWVALVFKVSLIIMQIAVPVNLPKKINIGSVNDWPAGLRTINPDSKLRWSQIGLTWILSAPRWVNVGPTCIAIWEVTLPLDLLLIELEIQKGHLWDLIIMEEKTDLEARGPFHK